MKVRDGSWESTTLMNLGIRASKEISTPQFHGSNNEPSEQPLNEDPQTDIIHGLTETCFS